MKIDKASEIAKVVATIEKCKDFLKSLDGRSYPDEFEIRYREGYTCDLEEEALQVLIDYYKKKLKESELKLESL
jgi:hypothetical protein